MSRPFQATSPQGLLRRLADACQRGDTEFAAAVVAELTFRRALMAAAKQPPVAVRANAPR